MERPLPADYVEYAVTDIRTMAQVHDYFVTKGYLQHTNHSLGALEQQTERYLNTHVGPLPADNRFIRSNLLPLEVIEPALPGPKATCDKCLRTLAAACFTYPAVQDGVRTSHASCKICHVLTVRERQKVQPRNSSKRHTSSSTRGRAPATGKSSGRPRQKVNRGPPTPMPSRRQAASSSRRTGSQNDFEVTAQEWADTLRETGFWVEADDIDGGGYLGHRS